MKRKIGAGFLTLGFLGSLLAQGALPLGNKASAAAQVSANKIRAQEAPAEVLRVYNWEDYILPDIAENNAVMPGLNAQFEEKMAAAGRNIKVIYENFDTNETMLNQLKTGKISYDLICPSDYMIQRLMAEDLILPFDNAAEYPGETTYYDQSASRYLLKKLAEIKAKDVYTTRKDQPDIAAKDVPLTANVVQKYMRGYMWGTMGLVYNDGFSAYQERGITPEKLAQDSQSWDILWNKEYRKTATVKDSVRDTYAVLILKAYEDEVNELHRQLEDQELTSEEYNQKLTEIFNRNDDETLKKVAAQLATLRDNIYGYEVDSGKDDIQKGRNIGLSLAWSGDAVYAMDMADKTGTYNLKYTLPQEGANIWFDGWVMTKFAREHNMTDIAQQYVDFLSAHAAENMAYIGYTPFIADEQVLTHVKESRGISQTARRGEKQESRNKDVSYFFQDTVGAGVDTHILYDSHDQGRQLDAMYPDEDQLPELVVMADYGERNAQVAAMWEAGKALTFPIWGYYVTLTVVILLVAIIVYSKLKHRKVSKLRKERHRALVKTQAETNKIKAETREMEKLARSIREATGNGSDKNKA